MKTYKQLLEDIDETLSFLEELEELDEANENFDSNSKAHQAAKKAVKGWRGLSKATYHSDGSATINTKERTKNRYGKEGHYSGLETTHSHSVVDQHLKYAGGMHNHSRDELDNHHQKIDGLHWKVKGKTVRGVGGTHEIHIHEEVEGLQELSKDTLKSYTTKRTMGVDPSGSTNPNTISSMKQKAKANSTLGNDAEAARLRNKAKISGKSTAKAYARMGDKGMPGSAVDKAAKKMPSSYRSEEFDFDLFESIMLGEGDLSIRTLYNKYADHALGAGDSPQPKKAAAVKKAITKVHGSTVMGHLEKAKNAAAKNDQESESHHFNAARNSAKTDTMGATVGKGRSSMRKEEVEQTDEALKGNQHKIDANKNGKVDAHDFKILRNAKKARYQ